MHYDIPVTPTVFWHYPVSSFSYDLLRLETPDVCINSRVDQ